MDVGCGVGDVRRTVLVLNCILFTKRMVAVGGDEDEDSFSVRVTAVGDEDKEDSLVNFLCRLRYTLLGVSFKVCNSSECVQYFGTVEVGVGAHGEVIFGKGEFSTGWDKRFHFVGT